MYNQLNIVLYTLFSLILEDFNLAPKQKKYRHEIKLLLSYPDYLVMSKCLKALLEPDEYAGDDGEYFIRSLYLDDVSHTAYWEKLAGAADRKKYRIRVYNCSDSIIKLECKEKRGSRICKRSATISRECFESIKNGDFSPLAQYDNDLCHEVLAVAKAKGLSPSVVVDYDREAYVHPVSNVRLTFDKALHAGVESADIFDDKMMTLPIYPDESVIFEVKYDSVLPKFLADIVSNTHGSKLALSKFCLCRDVLKAFKPTYR